MSVRFLFVCLFVCFSWLLVVVDIIVIVAVIDDDDDDDDDDFAVPDWCLSFSSEVYLTISCQLSVNSEKI